MKKILIILVGLLLLPFNVKAVDENVEFKIGERVAVLIENDNETKSFFVIRPSIAGDPYVWLFYDGNVGYNDGTLHQSITVYDEILPGEYEVEDMTGILEQSLPVYTVLTNGTATWKNRAEDIRLLNAEDISVMGLTKNSSGKYQIMGNRHFLKPLLTAPGVSLLQNPKSGYNYWTMISETNPSTGDISVYAVTYNESYNGDTLSPLATLEPYVISTLTGGSKFIVRPVIRVHKKYVDCKLDEETTVASVETFEVTFPLALVGVATIAGLGYVVIRKKALFNQI